MREIVHLQAGQCGNQIGAKVRTSFIVTFNRPRHNINVTYLVFSVCRRVLFYYYHHYCLVLTSKSYFNLNMIQDISQHATSS